MISFDQPKHPVRRELASYAVGLGVVVAGSNLAGETARLPLLVLGVGALAGFFVVNRLRRASPIGLRQAIPLVSFQDGPRLATRPAGLTRCEAMITEGTNRDKAADLRLRPHLIELCRSGLSDVGVDLDSDRRGATSRLGPAAMKTLEGTGIVSVEELHVVFTALEELPTVSANADPDIRNGQQN